MTTEQYTGGKSMSEDANQTTWDFFIAYAAADKKIAEDLYALLFQNTRVFLDSNCIMPGDNWDELLTHAQRNSRITIVLLSSQTEKAYYEREEIASAINMARQDAQNHRVVPIYLEGEPTPDSSIPYGLRLKHGLYLTEKNNLPQIADTLLKLKNQIKTNQTSSCIRLKQFSPKTDSPLFISYERLITIGRSPHNIIQLSDQEVSWEHGQIILKQGEYYYNHLSTTNPSVIRRKGDEYMLLPKSSQEICLRNQDRLIMGQTKFVIEFDLVAEDAGYTTTDKKPETRK